MNAQAFRESLTDAIRFWEPMRIAYNLTLAIVVLAYFWKGYPSSKSALNLNLGLGIFVLAVIANVAYCAAYVPDVFAQASGFRDGWRKYRWIVFAIGTLFAGIITRFIAMGMFLAAG
ncbi:MAG TPA: hypothetical protein VMD78_09315 [Candidatus Baltobacteraceae bacterium]|nr:hypothetical protein [Candidatus Baltobacteraceae bacterium]